MNISNIFMCGRIAMVMVTWHVVIVGICSFIAWDNFFTTSFGEFHVASRIFYLVFMVISLWDAYAQEKLERKVLND